MSDLNLDNLTDAQLRLFAVRCARRVQHLMTDPRSLAALDVAERHARGEATDAELKAAWDSATAAVKENITWSAMTGKDAAHMRAKFSANTVPNTVRSALLELERAAQTEILEQIRKEVQP